MRKQPDGTADSGQPFHRLWNFHNKRFSKPIRRLLLAGTAVVAGTIGIASGIGLIGAEQLAFIGLIAAIDMGLEASTQKRELQKARKAIEELPDADENTKDMTEALFRKAGLNYKPVIKQQGSIMSLSEAFNAAVIPVPTGPQKDEILVFVGRGLQLSLTDEELASVLAHETSHITNTSPAQTFLSRATRSINRAFFIAGAVTLNPLVCALSAGAGLLKHVFNNAAQKYDEDRADMNGIALFPHESAIEDALGQIYEVGEAAERINALDKPPGFLKRALRKALTVLLSDHRKKEERLPLLKEFHTAVEDFYKENDLDTDQAQDDILYGTGPGPTSFRFG